MRETETLIFIALASITCIGLLFYAFRKIILWYFKIDQYIELQKANSECLKEILSALKESKQG